MATWGQSTWSDPAWAGNTAPAFVPGESVSPGSIRMALALGAPLGEGITQPHLAVHPGSIRMQLRQGPVAKWVAPNTQPPIRPGSIRMRLDLPYGPRILPSVPPEPEPIDPMDLWVVRGGNSPRMTADVPGEVLEASCTPEINGPGSGEVTWRGAALDEGAEVRFSINGQAAFFGLVERGTRILRAAGEESEQLCSASVVGAIVELEGSIVLTDHAEQDFRNGDLDSILRSPVNDSRQFDWRQPGIFTGSGGAVILEDMVAKASGKLTGKKIPLPEPWPDQDAMWMRSGGSAGWRVFSGRTLKVTPRWDGSMTPVQVWCVVAEGIAEVYVDGARVLEVGSGMQPEVKVVDMTAGFHDVDIRAIGGQVAFTMREPGVAGLFGDVLLRSGGVGGFKTIPNPDRLLMDLPAVWDAVTSAPAAGGPVLGWNISMPAITPEAPVVLEVGMTILDLLNRFAEDYIDFAPSPSGRSAITWPKGSPPGGGSNPWGDTYTHHELNVVRK